MNKSLTFFVLLFLPVFLFGQIKTIAPDGKFETSFAIVIDSKTYQATKDAVEAYKSMLLGEGLGVYILIDETADADAIRNKLIDLYEGKSRLEGCVLIGDIPVPMIRDAQHLSSAFKMDQEAKWERSSIPSDRFYDDFGLKFRFLKKDEKNPLLYYYSLEPNSAMRLHSNIYSARIKPIIRQDAKSPHEQISDYLRKVVAERNTTNKVDNLMMFRGHGYNSDALEAWSGEQISLREQLPGVFKAGSKAKFLAYESYSPYKFKLIEELQREDLDIVLFHEHGSPDLQYINNYPSARSPQENIESVKYYVRGKVETGVRRKNDKEELKDYYAAYLGVPREWGEVTDSTAIADSIIAHDMDIHLEDIYRAKPNARFVMFDACYNGSFNNDEYIAGAYIFNEGKTIVALANSVNSLQDKFPDELIGLLGEGVRVGLWAKHINYLETHIIGDPTFRFAPTDIGLDLNKALVLKNKDHGYWLNLLNHQSADVQAIAIRRLLENNYPDISKLLKDTYLHSAYGSVRLEAIRLLVTLGNGDMVDVLEKSVSDPYELIRRLGLEYIGKNGTPRLIDAVINAMIYDNTSKRVMFKAGYAIGFFDPEIAEAALKVAIDKNTNLLNKDEVYDELIKSINYRKESTNGYIKEMNDTTLKVKPRITAIRSIRNMTTHYKLSEYIRFAANEQEDPILRETMLESLSWYYLSYLRHEIVALCDQILKSVEDGPLKTQALKTKNIIVATK